MIRVCPTRDTICPHGLDCPYVRDRYSCRPEPAKPTDPRMTPRDVDTLIRKTVERKLI